MRGAPMIPGFLPAKGLCAQFRRRTIPKNSTRCGSVLASASLARILWYASPSATDCRRRWCQWRANGTKEREWHRTPAIRYSLAVRYANELLDPAILNGTKTIHSSVTTKPASQPASHASAHSPRVALLLVALAATAVIAPMFFLGNASGHDFQFHLASWMDVAGQWREGILFPRWAEWANWGFGEPRFIFYPPASWTIGAFLGVLLPWMIVPGAYVWLALVVAGLSMWNFARGWLPEPQAIAAAALYMVNPYNLVI